MERIEDYDFGLRLKELRKRKNYTQKELAALIEVDPQMIYKYESNTQMPSIKKMVKLASVLNTSMDYLTGREKAPAIYIDGISNEDIRCLFYIAEIMKQTGKKE